MQFFIATFSWVGFIQIAVMGTKVVETNIRLFYMKAYSNIII